MSGHDLNVAVIFSSLQLFNVNHLFFFASNISIHFVFNLQIIRTPLTFLPIVLSTLSDALVSLGRISQFLTSEDLPEPYLIDKNLHVAVQVDGDFVWETVLATGDGEKGKFLHGDKGKKLLKGETPLPVTTADLEKEILKDIKNDQETPFELKNLKMSVPKGAFVGIVGRVGSGKV